MGSAQRRSIAERQPSRTGPLEEMEQNLRTKARIRAAGMAAAATLMATVGLGTSSGTAHADGLFLLKGWDTGQCLSINHTSLTITVDNCSKSDRWIILGTGRIGPDGIATRQLEDFPQTGL